MTNSGPRHKWIGNICCVCNITRKQIKRLVTINGGSKSEYYSEYYDVQGNLMAGRPMCKLQTK